MSQPLDLTVVRQLVMSEYQKNKDRGMDGKEARRAAAELVATACGISREELESLLGRDMLRHQNQAKLPDEKKLPSFNDENQPVFVDDNDDDMTTVKAHWLRDQLAGMGAGKVRSAVFETKEEADSFHKLVRRAAALLHWPSARKNPGWAAEVVPVGNAWKLKVKRLR